MALEGHKEKVVPVYEFECDVCGFISERFYRAVPRVDPMQIKENCKNCSIHCTHKKVLSLGEFHLKGGKVPWGEGKYSSASAKGGDVVSIDE